MEQTFLATLTPMLMLFCCIAVGFVARRAKLLPDNAGKVMAKLETWVFCPALNFSTMATYCTVASLTTYATNIAVAAVGVAIAVGIAFPVSVLFTRKNKSERGIYRYALAFANSGYVGDPLIRTLFGDVALSHYKIYCLPLSLMIYTWGVSVLTPEGKAKGGVLKKVLNAPTVAILLGVVVGLSGIGAHMPEFLSGTLNSLKGCMGPVAMLLAGFTIAGYGIPNMLKQKKVYVASLLRLVIIPTVIISLLFGLKELANMLFSLNIDNSVLYLAFFATATPLGLNTVVFPEAYGGDPKTGASMAMISHTLCVISIPLMLALLTHILGGFSIA